MYTHTNIYNRTELVHQNNGFKCKHCLFTMSQAYKVTEVGIELSYVKRLVVFIQSIANLRLRCETNITLRKGMQILREVYRKYFTRTPVRLTAHIWS